VKQHKNNQLIAINTNIHSIYRKKYGKFQHEDGAVIRFYLQEQHVPEAPESVPTQQTVDTFQSPHSAAPTTFLV